MASVRPAQHAVDFHRAIQDAIEALRQLEQSSILNEAHLSELDLEEMEVESTRTGERQIRE